MCVCNTTGNTLIWRTSLTGAVANFTSSSNAGDSESDGGFTAVLTERANGVSVSTLTFNPYTVRAVGSTGVDVTCEGFSVATNNIVVTPAGNVLVNGVVITLVLHSCCPWYSSVNNI